MANLVLGSTGPGRRPAAFLYGHETETADYLRWNRRYASTERTAIDHGAELTAQYDSSLSDAAQGGLDPKVAATPICGRHAA